MSADATPQPQSGLISFAQRITDLAERNGDAPAVTLEDETLSWRQLKECANRLGRDLAARGVQSGDTVTIALPNGPAWFVAFAATWKIGAVPPARLPPAATLRARAHHRTGGIEGGHRRAARSNRGVRARFDVRARPGQGQAMRRFQVLLPHLHDGVPLARAAAEADVPLRTAQRWLQRYRAGGLDGLARSPRTSAGRLTDAQLVKVIEGMALRKPRPSLASITRRAASIAAAAQGSNPLCYSTVRAIVGSLDPAMLTLAHDGPGVFRDTYELVYRRGCLHPNQMWQADHTQLHPGARRGIPGVFSRDRARRVSAPTARVPSV